MQYIFIEYRREPALDTQRRFDRQPCGETRSSSPANPTTINPTAPFWAAGSSESAQPSRKIDEAGVRTWRRSRDGSSRVALNSSILGAIRGTVGMISASTRSGPREPLHQLGAVASKSM